MANNEKLLNMLLCNLLLSLPDHRQWGEPGTGRLWSDKILWLEESDHFPIGCGLIWSCEIVSM